MKISSPVFENGGVIPKKYGKDYENINPPLVIEGVLAGTKSLALIVDDPDVPPQALVPVWDHWIVFNIPSSVTNIPEKWEIEGVRGAGTRGLLDYSGPKPPDKEHRYFFKLFALDCMLSLQEGATKTAVLAAIQGHLLEKAELIGRFAPVGKE